MLISKGNEGFDAARKRYVDLIEAGIIDPTKVVRIALENAVSVASVMLLTEATMTEIPEINKEQTVEPEMRCEQANVAAVAISPARVPARSNAVLRCRLMPHSARRPSPGWVGTSCNP
jgi:hypothetical protein